MLVFATAVPVEVSIARLLKSSKVSDTGPNYP
jgi:hypothetical protein